MSVIACSQPVSDETIRVEESVQGEPAGTDQESIEINHPECNTIEAKFLVANGFLRSKVAPCRHKSLTFGIQHFLIT